jgi:Zn ribbon nucleic-acid-binding protein
MANGIRRSEPQRSGVVEYGLVRHSLIEAVRRGRVRREDVCDAHPELLRAAANLGRPTGQTCPVCDADPTVEVTYVFGAKLPPGGTCPSTKAELARLERREDPVICYAVEACTACGFHHLARKWQAGGKRVRRSVKGAKSEAR